MRLVILNQSGQRLPRRWLSGRFSRLKRELRTSGFNIPEKLQLTLVFLSPSEAKVLNKKFRRKNYATDVLSFEGDGLEIWGELVFCPEVLKAQADEAGHSFRQELLLMLVHGVLHLFGLDHERSARDAKRMLTLQAALLSRLL